MNQDSERKAGLPFAGAPWLDAAEEIASEYTHTKFKDGVAEIIAKHFADDVADAERFRWLIKQGVAWRGSYDEHWLPGEWLYSAQDARHFVDKAMAEASNSVITNQVAKATNANDLDKKT